LCVSKLLVLQAMKKNFIFFLFVPFFVFAQERIDLKNNILDSITFFPVGSANIYNFNFNSYLFTKKRLKFDFLEKKKDTNEYKLPETYAEFKKEFFKTKFTKGIEVGDIGISYEEKIKQMFSEHGLLAIIPGKVGQAIMHPITFLYETFARKPKMDRLYKYLIDNQEEVYNLSQKYNQELVTSITGLEGEERLDFMTFCKFSYYDLVRWSPEFIVLQIKKRYDDYEYYKLIEEDY